MRLEIHGSEMPGRSCGDLHTDVHVAVQRGSDPDQRVAGDAAAATFTATLSVREAADGGYDFGGPFVHGKRGDRFVYLTWGDCAGGDFAMFRRAKITLDPANPVLAAAARDGGRVRVNVGMSDRHGLPVCARFAPDAMRWERLAG